jgi:hypothetical protein
MNADANIKTIAEISQKRTFSPKSACINIRPGRLSAGL